jgi:transcription elongation GreA/GreB family factor
MNSQNLKQKLFDCCKAIIETRISNARTAMDAAQQSANGEGKSSAGDKYETSRAMGHLDRNMNAKQLAEAMDTLQLLNSLNIAYSPVIQPGSLVITTMGNYFISVGAGNVKLEGKDYFAVSPLSPIAQILIGKKASDALQFNGKELKLMEVY